MYNIRTVATGLLYATLLLLVVQPANASFNTARNCPSFFYEWGSERIVKVMDFPNTPDFHRPDGTYLDVGIKYKQIKILSIPLWNYDKRFCGYVGQSDQYIDLSQDELNQYAEYAKLELPQHPQIPLWDAVGGKLVLVVLLGGLILWNIRSEKKEEKEQVFMTCLFGMAAKLCKADGHVSESEVAALDYFMKVDLQFDDEQRRTAIEVFKKEKDSDIPIENYAALFHQHYRDQPQILEWIVMTLAQIAVCDGEVSETEVGQIVEVCVQFAIPQARVYEILGLAIPSSGTSSPYDVLGCSESATMDEVKKRYRELVHQYHPDKISGKGLPADFTRFAESRFKEIQSAYEQVMKQREPA